MECSVPIIEELQQLVGDLARLRPHGWPDPGLVIKPPFHPASVTMPPGWAWGCSTLGDASDLLEAFDSHPEGPNHKHD